MLVVPYPVGPDPLFIDEKLALADMGDLREPTGPNPRHNPQAVLMICPAYIRGATSPTMRNRKCGEVRRSRLRGVEKNSQIAAGSPGTNCSRCR